MRKDFLANPLREKLAAGEPSLGSWVWYTDPSCAEAMAQAGFDWLLIDLEHSFIGAEALRNIIVAIEGRDCVPLVRVKVDDIDSIKLALDCGACGVIIPQVNSADDVCWAVTHTKYAPLGKRGIGALRASRYGDRWGEYLRRANEQLLTLVQIEDRAAVDHLQEMLRVPGLDGIFIGTFDLSQSLGIVPGEADSRLDASVDYIIEAAREARLPVGTVCSTLEDVLQCVERGVLLPTVGSDVEFMLAGARAAAAGWKQKRGMAECAAKRPASA